MNFIIDIFISSLSNVTCINFLMLIKVFNRNTSFDLSLSLAVALLISKLLPSYKD